MRATDRSAEELDAAIEELLVDSARPTSIETAELMATARLLHDELPRYHPRFGFEEHLARRLAGADRGSAASTARASQETGGHAPGSGLLVLPASTSAEGAALLTRRRRGLLAGGAIASGVSLVIPLAGAALVAWRRGRTASGGL